MMKRFRKKWIPWAMASGRGLLGFVLIDGQRANWNTFALAGIVVMAWLVLALSRLVCAKPVTLKKHLAGAGPR